VERKRLLRYGLFNNFNDAGTFFLESRVDNFFIAGFMNAVSVGIYSFYLRLNEMAMNMLPGPSLRQTSFSHVLRDQARRCG